MWDWEIPRIGVWLDDPAQASSVRPHSFLIVRCSAQLSAGSRTANMSPPAYTLIIGQTLLHISYSH